MTDATRLHYNPDMGITLKISEGILSQLRAKGHRITRARGAMVSIFTDANAPLGAPELGVLMTELGAGVNKTTIYRELEFLKLEGVIAEVNVGDGVRRYELMPKGHHHHHLVCNGCSAVECIEVERCVEDDLRDIEKKSDFKVTDHSLKFFGLCARCRS